MAGHLEINSAAAGLWWDSTGVKVNSRGGEGMHMIG